MHASNDATKEEGSSVAAGQVEWALLLLGRGGPVVRAVQRLHVEIDADARFLTGDRHLDGVARDAGDEAVLLRELDDPGNHIQYAVDFSMPEGTTVCAARDGVVVDLMESSEVGGPDRNYKDDANFVSIAHDDGTIGEYVHLKRDGVLVEIGDKVKAGQPIALSGNTGYSTAPHLHFGVYSPRDVHRLRSHAITFTTARATSANPPKANDTPRSRVPDQQAYRPCAYARRSTVQQW